MQKKNMIDFLYFSLFFIVPYCFSKWATQYPSFVVLVVAMLNGHLFGIILLGIKNEKKSITSIIFDLSYIFILLIFVFSWELIFEFVFQELTYPYANSHAIKTLFICIGFALSILSKKLLKF